MSKARLVITAVVVEGRTQGEVAREYPDTRETDTHNRVRHDRVDDAGSVTLRTGGRLHHIGVGRTHARTRVLMLVQDLHVRITVRR